MMMMMMVVVMAVEVQSQLQPISRGRGIFGDLVDRQTDTDIDSIAQHSIFLFCCFHFFFFFFLQHTFLYFGFDLRHWVVFKNIFHIYAFIWDMYLNYKLMETLCNSTILDLRYLEIQSLNCAMSSFLGCKTYRRRFWEKSYLKEGKTWFGLPSYVRKHGPAYAGIDHARTVLTLYACTEG